MKKGPLMPERDREATENRLLETVGEMIRESGFERIGINAVADRSGVSKILIYRYFGSVDGLVAAYLRRHDFWSNIPTELPGREALPEFLKQMFRTQIERLRRDPVLCRLHRWELSADNAIILQLREQREATGRELVHNVSRIAGRNEADTAAVATLLSTAVTYLTMLADSYPLYNGIPLDDDRGWEQIACGIDLLIDSWFNTREPETPPKRNPAVIGFTN